MIQFDDSNTSKKIKPSLDDSSKYNEPSDQSEYEPPFNSDISSIRNSVSQIRNQPKSRINGKDVVVIEVEQF